MRRRIFCGFVFFSLAALVAGCAVKRIQPIEKGKREWGRGVLIATQKSEFKEAVTHRIIDSLEKDRCYIKVVDLGSLANEAPEQYRAIVIMNSYHFWRLSGEAKSFIKNAGEDQQRKIILLTTVGEEFWSPGVSDVDSISSASEISKASSVAKSIIARIRVLVGCAGHRRSYIL